MPHDARDIANFFLDYADEKKFSIDIMSLLKLIYFAHGWHLAKYDQPLVSNSFEAWQHGPVVRAVYESFAGSKKSFIKKRAYKFNPVTAQYDYAQPHLNTEESTLLRDVFNAYAHLGAVRLSDITHEQGSPWDRLWHSSDKATHPGMKISNESIRQHFRQQHHLQTVN